MDLVWMGKYRKLIEKMIKFGNTYARKSRGEHSYNTPITFSASDMQVLECVLENEQECENMVGIAERLGISKSAFSKHTKRMVEKGLLERYRMADNQKNIIIKVSDYGKEIYQIYAEYTYETAFKKMFQVLDGVPDEYIDKFTEAMEIASQLASADKGAVKEAELIKIEDV